MKKVMRVIWSTIGIVLSNKVLSSTIESNAINGVYPPESDTIFIPIASSWIISILMFVSILVCVLSLSKNKWLGVFGGMFGAVAVFLSVLTTLSWFMPNHYEISVVYILLSIWFVYITATVAKEPFNKNKHRKI